MLSMRTIKSIDGHALLYTLLGSRRQHHENSFFIYKLDFSYWP